MAAPRRLRLDPLDHGTPSVAASSTMTPCARCSTPCVTAVVSAYPSRPPTTTNPTRSPAQEWRGGLLHSHCETGRSRFRTLRTSGMAISPNFRRTRSADEYFQPLRTLHSALHLHAGYWDVETIGTGSAYSCDPMRWLPCNRYLLHNPPKCYPAGRKSRTAMVESGTILGGKYRVESLLGKGGMGIVVHAHHLQLDQPVAIKLLRPDAHNNNNLMQRFLREAQAAVKLRSEHNTRVFDVGTLDDGTPYMVMEYLEGMDLGHLLRTHGPLMPAIAVNLVLQACAALTEAHTLGIVHRDIKPSNLFLTRGTDGVPLLKVIDFGIAKAQIAAENSDMTRSHAIMGTPSYMSPEQVRSSKHVDLRADIWALGVVLYELVSGRRPFQADNLPALSWLLATEPMMPLDDVVLPKGLVPVIARCLEKDPVARFQSMAELAAALGPYADSSIRATPLVEQAIRLRNRVEEQLGTAETHASLSGDQRPLSTFSEGVGQDVSQQATRLGRRLQNVARPPTSSPASANTEPVPWWWKKGTLALGGLAIGGILAFVLTQLPTRNPDAILAPISAGPAAQVQPEPPAPSPALAMTHEPADETVIDAGLAPAQLDTDTRVEPMVRNRANEGKPSRKVNTDRRPRPSELTEEEKEIFGPRH
jgi:eukaryotic-like serine/threonine-protein kinase